MFGNNGGWYFRVHFWRSSSKRRSQRYLMCSRSALFRPIYLKTTRITPSPPFRLRLRLRLMTVTILCKIMVLLLLYHSCSIQTRLNEKIPFAIISFFFFLGFSSFAWIHLLLQFYKWFTDLESAMKSEVSAC